jgi:FixJ family two-component response regulator
MNCADRIAYIVTGNAALGGSLRESLGTRGLAAALFGSAAEYLGFARPDVAACLILDLYLPDMNGLHLQQRIAATHAPIVFVVGGPADVASSVRALKAGAVDFLTSPVCSSDLFCAVEWAIELDRRTTPERIRLAQLHACYERLTPREREVLPLIVSGRLNKQAALDLGISENTLQIHRRRVMRKMEAQSLPDLVRMADALNVPCSRTRHGRKPKEVRSAPFHLATTFDTAGPRSW